jgi:hypothetical protein
MAADGAVPDESLERQRGALARRGVEVDTKPIVAPYAAERERPTGAVDLDVDERDLVEIHGIRGYTEMRERAAFCGGRAANAGRPPRARSALWISCFRRRGRPGRAWA